MPLLLVSVLWYLFITSILSVFQSAIERYYARGDESGSQGKGLQLGTMMAGGKGDMA